MIFTQFHPIDWIFSLQGSKEKKYNEYILSLKFISWNTWGEDAKAQEHDDEPKKVFRLFSHNLVTWKKTAQDYLSTTKGSDEYFLKD